MTYREMGFRPFYHHFCSLPLTKKTAGVIDNFPGADIADSYLTYGYIDPERGLTLEVIAPARKTDKGLKEGNTCEKRTG